MQSPSLKAVACGTPHTTHSNRRREKGDGWNFSASFQLVTTPKTHSSPLHGLLSPHWGPVRQGSSLGWDSLACPRFTCAAEGWSKEWAPTAGGTLKGPWPQNSPSQEDLNSSLFLNIKHLVPPQAAWRRKKTILPNYNGYIRNCSRSITKVKKPNSTCMPCLYQVFHRGLYFMKLYCFAAQIFFRASVRDFYQKYYRKQYKVLHGGLLSHKSS